MKTAIIGTGAMGAVYAALLAEAGVEVIAVDCNAAHIDAIRDNGLWVEGASGARYITGLQATTDPSEAADAELFVIATKAADAADAARSIAPYIGAEAMVLTMQNGLGPAERVAEIIPERQLLVGVGQGFGASLLGPGRAHHNGLARVIFAARDPSEHRRRDAVGALWRDAGFPVELYDDADRLVWEKFIFNVAFSAPCAVFGRRVKEMLEDPASRAFVMGAAAEADRTARAKGVRLGFEKVEAYIERYAQGVLGATPSLAQDLKAKRRSEIDVINGAVPREAAVLGIDAPFNTALTAAVRAIEDGFAA